LQHNLQVFSTKSIYEDISQRLATDDLGQRKMQTNIHCNFIISTTVHALQCFGCKGKKTPQQVVAKLHYSPLCNEDPVQSIFN